ncbi:TonB C-terminal domain-containing protein [Helicobacter cappadocius]|uniref:TonB C-terminal domain-containing protein n=1 Tax=Helicobacter cappadocius TaxID=3063998 RepID=A0AA90SS70_9HELI|nr:MULTISPECIES: TonB C-terminal domain-containing protein [unclassified Helicobacter]MDO7252756.1 TonB C-terminal domain-containing protein [Helicobacter sp. faydin-H75]MDP2538624.1 TonB C-terminal domain-containing protein [Helicobacter sp. faydin-H76]
MNTKKLFILSGIFSVAIYFIVIFSLIFGFNLSNPKRYVSKSDTSIEQSISIDAIVSSFEKQDQEDKGGSPVEGTGIKDIFSSIDSETQPTDEISDNRDEIAKNLELNKKRKKAFEEIQGNLQNINSKLQNIRNKTIDIKSQTPKPDTSDGLYDEWFSKVYKILYSKWNASFYQNASVSVLLTITDNGDFSYKILRYSRYDEYNKSVQALLDSLQGKKFPPYPKGKSISIEVNFKTEGN